MDETTPLTEHTESTDDTPLVDTPIVTAAATPADATVETGEMAITAAIGDSTEDPLSPDSVSDTTVGGEEVADGLFMSGYEPAAEDAVFATPAAAAVTAQPEPAKNRSMLGTVMVALIAGVVGALLVVGILAATGTFDSNTEAEASAAVTATTVPATPIVTEITNEAGAAVNPTAVAVKVLPSVVTVNVFDDAGGDTSRVATGSGSGVVMSADGYIITNHHVIDGADTFDVVFEDARIYPATLVGSDSLTDLAVLRIEADVLVPVDFGSTDDLLVGDPAVAVGNPLGQQGGASITAGIVSAFDRRVDFADGTSLFGMIQTDAAINSGSSGGALVDAEGKLVGITSAIGVSTAGPEGIGYAIPIELVDRITSEIIETGDVIHPFLGVTIQTFFETASDGATIPAGAIIESIEGADSAAGSAGLEAGDIIIQIGDDEITSQSDLILAVRLYRVGEIVTFTVDRNGATMAFDVTMGQRPPEFQG